MMEGEAGRPTAEAVISKLKDDGDFDALRVKIIRKLKENEELRKCILAEVKQSAALNRDGAENLKPRQLSDAINQEIGYKIKDQISDEVWKIIRSNDGMKNEIRDTVEYVYNKIVNPKVPEANDVASPRSQSMSAKDCDVSPTISVNEPSKPPGFATASIGEATSQCDNEPSEPPGFATASTGETTTLYDTQQSGPPGFAMASTVETTTSGDNEPSEPPGFALRDQIQVVNLGKGDQNHSLHDQQLHVESKRELHEPADMLLQVPDFSESFRHTQMPGDGSDDDPDVPPGFG